MKRTISLLLMLTMLSMLFVGCAKKESEMGGDVDVKDPKEDVAEKFDYPKKNINITVPYNAGSNTDLRTRMLAEFLKEKLDTNIIITNLGGAGGTVGASEFFAGDKGDHDLIVNGISVFSTALIKNDKLPYTFEDFVPVRALDYSEQILFVHKDSGITSFEKLVEYGKNNIVKFGGGGPTSANYIVQSAVYKTEGMQAESISQSSTAERITAILGGVVDVTVTPPNNAADYVKSGDLIPIAIMASDPYTGFDGIVVPTLEELGHDIMFQAYNIISMPAGTDQEVVDYLSSVLEEIYNDEEYQKRAQDLGMFISYDDSEQVTSRVVYTQHKFQELIDFIK